MVVGAAVAIVGWLSVVETVDSWLVLLMVSAGWLVVCSGGAKMI